MLLRDGHVVGPPVDPFGLAQLLGIMVVRAGGLPPSLDGFAIAGTRSHLIVLRGHPWPTRARVTVAHEIAHLLLHTDEAISFDGQASCRYSAPLEDEARAFAAALLMPEPWVRSALRTGYHFRRLCSRFEVSKQMGRRRLAALGLVMPH